MVFNPLWVYTFESEELVGAPNSNSLFIYAPDNGPGIGASIAGFVSGFLKTISEPIYEARETDYPVGTGRMCRLTFINDQDEKAVQYLYDLNASADPGASFSIALRTDAYKLFGRQIVAVNSKLMNYATAPNVEAVGV